MTDPFANFNINKSLVKKWMKMASASTRKSKALLVMGHEGPVSSLIPGISYPRSKSSAEDMFDGKRQYIIGFIQHANQQKMAKLRRDVTSLFTNANNKKRVLYPGYSKLIYDFMGNNNTRSNRSHMRSKEWILNLLAVYDKNNVKSSSSLISRIYDALPAKYEP